MNPDKITTLYGAIATFPNDFEKSAEFHCQPIVVKRFLPDFGESFEVEGNHYLSPNYRTSHIPLHMLNRENYINSKQATFFSEDMMKCVSWLEKIKRRIMDYHISQYEQLKSIPIEIEETEAPLSLIR